MVKLSGQAGSAVRAAVLLLAFLPSLAGNVAVAEGASAAKKTAASKVPLLHLSDAHQGREYAFRIRGVTGVDITDFKCEVSPALPDGLSLDCARLTITGTPTGAVGTTSGAIRIYDSSQDEVSVNYEIDVVNHPDEAWIGAAPVLKRRAVVQPAAPASKPVRETVQPVGVGAEVAVVRPGAAVVQPASERERRVLVKPVPSASSRVESQQAGTNFGGGTKMQNAVLTSVAVPVAALTADPVAGAGLAGAALAGAGGGYQSPSACAAGMAPGDEAASHGTISSPGELTGGEGAFTLRVPLKAGAAVKDVVVRALDAGSSSGTWRTLDQTITPDNSDPGKITVTLGDKLVAGQTVYVEVTGNDPDTFGTGVDKASMCGQKVYTGLQVVPVTFTTVLKEGVQVITGTATPSTGASIVNVALVDADSYDEVERSQDLPGAVDQALQDAESATAAQSGALSQAVQGTQTLNAADRFQLQESLGLVKSQLLDQNAALKVLESHLKPIDASQHLSLTEQEKRDIDASITSAAGLLVKQRETLAEAQKKASQMSSPDKVVVIGLLQQAVAATEIQRRSLYKASILAGNLSQTTANSQAVDSCIALAGLASLTDELVPLNSSGTPVGYAPTSNTGNFTLSLATATYAGQRFRPVQIFPQNEERTEAQNLLCAARTSTVKATLDWGRVHADFVGGLLISNDSAGPTADNATPSGSFSQAHQFYALNVEKVWALPGCYLRIPAHDQIDPADSTKKTWVRDQCYDWNTGKRDNARKKQHLWPGVSTYFQARLTAIPVSNASTVKQDTPAVVAGGTVTAKATKVNAAADPTTPTTPAATTDQTTANLISTAQTAKVEVGIYFPFLISRWEYEHRPNALFIAPLAKVGIDTVTGPSTTVTIDANGTGTTSHSFEQIYNNWSYGARVGHMELGRSASKAPETYSYFDITFGPYSNLQSYICHGSDHATTLPATSTCLQPPSTPFVVSNGVDSRKRLYRLDIEGLLKIPATPLYVGLNANLGQKTLGATGLDRSYAAPDDLRFFFGTKFDIAQVLMKFVK